jgi:hypothetical protein
MENVVIALGITIAVVLVLLLSCWKGNKNKKINAQMQKPAPRRSSASRRRYRDDNDILNMSEYGSGVYSRNANNRYSDLKDVQGYGDYNSVAQYMSVEPEVYDSHSKYSKDMGRSTSGPSSLSVRDDPNDVVPWVVRKPFYQDSYVQQGARQEHSEYPDQMRNKTYYVIS